MSENKYPVAMFITDEEGVKTQVGWASPVAEGVRTFEFSPGYSGENRPALKNVSFSDENEPEPPSDPVYISEKSSGDSPSEEPDSNEPEELDEEAEFERELAEEAAALSRKELRETKDESDDEN